MCHALPPGFRVHAGAMHLRLCLAHKAVLVESQVTSARQRPSQDQSLIKASFAFARMMQRDRNDQFGITQRSALLSAVHLFSQPACDVRLSF